MSEAPDLLAALGRSVEKAREARQADSRIERAARVLSNAPWDDLTVTEQVRWLNAATRLDAAGLLATPEYDAAVAARALREAAADLDRRVNDPALIEAADRYSGYYAGVRSAMQRESQLLLDHIEREGGTS